MTHIESFIGECSRISPMKMERLKFPYRWEERRPEVAQDVLFIPDYYERHQEWEFPTWEKIFGNSNPVVIEYCSGNGTWIADKAQDKQYNWVAVEWRFERVQKIWAKKKRRGLDNLFIVCGDANIFIRDYLKDVTVDGVYVNFPDPWPKDRHAKNRLFQAPFIADLHRTLKPAAHFTVVTDDAPYGQQLTDVVFQNGGWDAVFPSPYYVNTWEGYGASYFDSLWRDKGREIKYFQFLKKSAL